MTISRVIRRRRDRPSTLRQALCKLNFLGDDPFLRMQAFNLAIVDQFLMELESQLLILRRTELIGGIPESGSREVTR
jgi:hypothetical protein